MSVVSLTQTRPPLSRDIRPTKTKTKFAGLCFTITQTRISAVKKYKKIHPLFTAKQFNNGYQVAF